MHGLKKKKKMFLSLESVQNALKILHSIFQHDMGNKCIYESKVTRLGHLGGSGGTRLEQYLRQCVTVRMLYNHNNALILKICLTTYYV